MLTIDSVEQYAVGLGPPLPSLLVRIGRHVPALQREERISEKEGIAFLALLPEVGR
jgi:hypothetical protein